MDERNVAAIGPTSKNVLHRGDRLSARRECLPERGTNVKEDSRKPENGWGQWGHRGGEGLAERERFRGAAPVTKDFRVIWTAPEDPQMRQRSTRWSGLRLVGGQKKNVFFFIFIFHVRPCSGGVYDGTAVSRENIGLRGRTRASLIGTRIAHGPADTLE